MGHHLGRHQVVKIGSDDARRIPQVPESMTDHWFEPIAEHLGAAYLRYSFTKGTRQEVDHVVAALALQPGERVLDVGCGPGRHAHELARRGIAVHGVDISERFIELAREHAPAGATFERLDARNLPFDGEFDAAICLCQGAFGLMTVDGDDGAVIAGIARALRPGGRLALSAFNAYFAVKYHHGGDVRRRSRCRPRAHRGPGSRRAGDRRRPVDGLLHAARAPPAPGPPRPRRRPHLERRARCTPTRDRSPRRPRESAGRCHRWDPAQMQRSIAIDQGPLLPSYPASGAYPVPGRPPGIVNTSRPFRK